MKKTPLIILGILVACIFLAGIFSTGLVIGKFLLQNEPQTNQPIVEISEPSETETSMAEANTSEDEVEATTAPESPHTPSPTPIEVPPPSGDLEDLFVPFWEAWDIVHEYYVDQPVDEEAMMEGAILGMIEAMQIPTNTLSAEITGIEKYNQESNTPDDLQELFIPFWQYWALAHAVEDKILVQGAIRGMLEALGDPHTSYMDPEDYTMATMTFEGEEEYEGIGAWVDISADYLTIITPFPDSPAEKAGLQPGDKIMAIDGEDMTGLDGELVRQKVLGPAGTTITITILRDGIDPFDVDVTRASVLVPSIESYMMDDNIGYVRLFIFGDKTDEELREALQRLLAEDPDGLILDLRYNGGGGVDTAVAVASEFIEDGVIFYEIYGDGTRDTHEASGKGIAYDIPLVVLVNEGSASASEIVSGALQDYDRAPLVGTKTFGKGSVQYWIPLSDEKGAVRVTIASWITPEERLIHQIGLEPDYPIIGIPQSAIDEGFDLSSLEMDPKDIVILTEEDIQQGVDIQLEKAIEILLDMAQ
jgi:carboxyl-terminal processing protease